MLLQFLQPSLREQRQIESYAAVGVGKKMPQFSSSSQEEELQHFTCMYLPVSSITHVNNVALDHLSAINFV